MNVNSCPNYNGKVEGCNSMMYSRDTEVSFLISCSLKVTQYMYQPTSQLYSIWMSLPKVLYR